ncbi:Uncharacterized protein APZ42_021468 [Daphnia magna]|uniref:Uncharacterized protein n=1 Tax=Daphnia magna TaxID=35525 RepID=A0A164WMV5_9CRUS|nr:Uncharacterized protein APZ42_021468 [Daphnia magna]
MNASPKRRDSLFEKLKWENVEKLEGLRDVELRWPRHCAATRCDTIEQMISSSDGSCS